MCRRELANTMVCRFRFRNSWATRDDFVDVAAADSQKAVHDRRIVEDEKFLSGRRAVFFDHLEIGFRQARGEFARIRDRRRGADELRVRAVEARDAPQPPQHVGQVAAEHAAIRVQFVQHDVAQILEQPLPARVVRQDSGVQHVRIRQHDVPALANRLARVGGRIAVVGEDAEAIVETRGQVVQLGELILRERFGREKVERARVRIFEDRVQDRQVVAQRFPGRRRRNHHNVAPLLDGFRGHGLVAIQLRDAFFRIGCAPVRGAPIPAWAQTWPRAPGYGARR